MFKPRTYNHLSAEDRAVIMIDYQNGSSARTIADRLGRSPSTISRELRRGGDHSTYDAPSAAQAYRERRLRCRKRYILQEGTALHRFVHDKLVYRRWSPAQIAATLKVMPIDERPGLVSHETIYAAIYAHPRGALKQGMIQALRQARATRGRRRTTTGKGSCRFVPEAQRIAHRPEEVQGRKLPGHWEGDFIKGAYNRSAVGTLVERKTRFVVLCRMDGCTATNALEGFDRQMKKLPAFLRESLTYDRGSEMASHEELARRLNIDIWFADPHAPWQRGSNENTNGLLRQFLPKGMDLSTVSQTQLNDIARLLNSRPRMTLGWKTPEQALAIEMAEYAKRVALDS